jgi:hypothetical protein
LGRTQSSDRIPDPAGPIHPVDDLAVAENFQGQAVYRKFRSMFSGAPPEPAAESGFSLSLNDDQTKD